MRWSKQADVVVDETSPELAAGPVDLVDAALRVAAGRQFFTRDEALGLLHEVEAGACGHTRAMTVERIVGDVDSSSADQMMIPRTELLDPLLDIRLALCT